eukprot:5519893-Amphidinium_carterae.2
MLDVSKQRQWSEPVACARSMQGFCTLQLCRGGRVCYRHKKQIDRLGGWRPLAQLAREMRLICL